ncbi:DUF4056 domain-containing protein [Parasalinivibrio latis]
MLLGSLMLGTPGLAFADAPVGVRPCCAFGKDLKAQLGGVPVPFFSVGNVLDVESLGNHIYNDGSQGVSSSLLGLGEEHNGLIYTEKGGFIDTAHVRDTADFTYFLFNEMRHRLGTSYTIKLPAELRNRLVVLKARTTQLTDAEKENMAIHAAGLTAFRLAQWHEIAQWFGMESVGGFKELASAFSPEDLYSNMLGAKLAMAILAENPDASVEAFGKSMDASLKATLEKLHAVSADETSQKIASLDGKWWDSSKRLPDKWVLLHRDYHLALDIYPNGTENGMRLSLPDKLENGEPVSSWVQLELRKGDRESAFILAPSRLKHQDVWTPEDFMKLAGFAKVQDELEKSHLK